MMKTIFAGALALAVITAPARAIDFSATMLNPDGQAYKRCSKPDDKNPNACIEWVDQTLGRFVAEALNIIDQSLGNEGIIVRGLLADKVRGAREIDLDDKQRDVIKAALLASYSKANITPTAIVQALKSIDPAALKDK